MKRISYGELREMGEDLETRYIDASYSVLLILYDRGAKNVALYKRIIGGDAEIKTRGEKFGFLGKHSEFVVLTQDYNRFYIAISDKADEGNVRFQLIGKRGEQQGVSAILVFNRKNKPDFRLRGIVEEDSAMRYWAFGRRFENEKNSVYLDEYVEPLLAALPERFDLELFMNQALGRTEKYVREMRRLYD